jgi:hypothetical protein
MPWTAFIPGAVLFGIAAEAIHLFTVYFLADKLASAESYYGALGLAATGRRGTRQLKPRRGGGVRRVGRGEPRVRARGALQERWCLEGPGRASVRLGGGGSWR